MNFQKALQTLTMNKSLQMQLFEEKLWDYKDFSIVWKIYLWKKWNQEYFIDATFNQTTLSFFEKISYNDSLYLNNTTILSFNEFKNKISTYIKNIDLTKYWFEKIKKEIIEEKEIENLFDESNLNKKPFLWNLDLFQIYLSSFYKIFLNNIDKKFDLNKDKEWAREPEPLNFSWKPFWEVIPLFHMSDEYSWEYNNWSYTSYFIVVPDYLWKALYFWTVIIYDNMNTWLWTSQNRQEILFSRIYKWLSFQKETYIDKRARSVMNNWIEMIIKKYKEDTLNFKLKSKNLNINTGIQTEFRNLIKSDIYEKYWQNYEKIESINDFSLSDYLNWTEQIWKTNRKEPLVKLIKTFSNIFFKNS